MNNNNHIPIVVITDAYRWNYFEWFLLGFYKLQEKGLITLRFELKNRPWSTFLQKSSIPLVERFVDHNRRIKEADSYNLDGYIIDINGLKHPFTIDSADAPFLFDEDKLKQGWTYFKMQCPIDLISDTFELAPEVDIPWCDHKHVNPSISKLTERAPRKIIVSLKPYLSSSDGGNGKKTLIHPLMVGPRMLSKGISQKSIEEGYYNYLSDRKLNKKHRIMCYFGNSQGPKPEDFDTPTAGLSFEEKKKYISSHIDYDWEADLMGAFKDKMNHPNEKRAKVAEILKTIPDTDARIITQGNADTGVTQHPELVVPLEKFCGFISDFQYNVNVSGYRLSIPNRFIESFMVGTAIVTDKLHCRWYKDFGAEVVETGDMGYRNDSDVNWDKVRRDLENLPQGKAEEVIKAFNEKWSPEVIGQYILDTVMEE